MPASSNNNMLASITASLEKSLQNCSLNHHHHQASSSSDSPGNLSNFSGAATTLDLNSQISLPYHWEQCLDLKSGEIYYINWRTGMKAREDPRTSPEDRLTTDLYYSEEEEEEGGDDDDDDDDEDEEEEDIGDDNDNDSSSSSSSSHDNDSEQGKLKSSSSAAGASSSMTEQLYHHDDDDEDDGGNNPRHQHHHQVLVVAGCRVCLMYFMVPKQVQHCPKCTTAQLLHFL